MRVAWGAPGGALGALLWYTTLLVVLLAGVRGHRAQGTVQPDDCETRTNSVQIICEAVGPDDWGCKVARDALRRACGGSSSSSKKPKAEEESTCARERQMIGKLLNWKRNLHNLEEQMTDFVDGGTEHPDSAGGIDMQRLLAPQGPQGQHSEQEDNASSRSTADNPAKRLQRDPEAGTDKTQGLGESLANLDAMLGSGMHRNGTHKS